MCTWAAARMRKLENKSRALSLSNVWVPGAELTGPEACLPALGQLTGLVVFPHNIISHQLRWPQIHKAAEAGFELRTLSAVQALSVASEAQCLYEVGDHRRLVHSNLNFQVLYM